MSVHSHRHDQNQMSHTTMPRQLWTMPRKKIGVLLTPPVDTVGNSTSFGLNQLPLLPEHNGDMVRSGWLRRRTYGWPDVGWSNCELLQLPHGNYVCTASFFSHILYPVWWWLMVSPIIEKSTACLQCSCIQFEAVLVSGEWLVGDEWLVSDEWLAKAMAHLF